MARPMPGIPIPPAIGGAPPPMPMGKPPMNPNDPDNDGDNDSGGVKIDPSAVNYHDELHTCKGCSYYGGGNCQVLQMQVSADGGCTAFSAGDSGGNDPDGDVGASSSDANMGDSGTDDYDS